MSTSQFAASTIDRTVQLPNGLSVDVEDYFQVEAFAAQVSRDQWPHFAMRVRKNTIRVLELLERNSCKATFFILGWVAEAEPALIRDIAEAGHELGCHSHLHRLVYQLSPEEFREDVRRAKNTIEDVGRIKVAGFRAPTFSITQKSLWALDILADEGFDYDSSIVPVHHDRYGIPDAPRSIHRRYLPSGRSLWEIPPSTVQIGSLNIPFAGGGYLRMLPMAFTRWAIRRSQQQPDHEPLIVYFHPWELDADQPRINAKWSVRWRHYHGLEKMEQRLQEVLSNRRFDALVNLIPTRWSE